MRKFASFGPALLLPILLLAGPRGEGPPASPPGAQEPPVRMWEFFELAELEAGGDEPYREFLHVPSMTGALVRLDREATDRQSAHDRDELYHVVSGRAVLRVAGHDQPVGPGSIVFVRRGVEHGFRDIREPLRVLVVFAGDGP